MELIPGTSIVEIMRNKFVLTLAATLIIVNKTVAPASPKLKVAPLPFVSPMFGDNMVLQRDKPNRIWGWSKPGQMVRVEIAGRRARSVTGADGRWEVRIQPPPVGGPYILKISGPHTLELHNVLVGDVWLCGGQSNMYMGLTAVRDGDREASLANNPNMRLFIVNEHSSYSPTAVPQGTWRVASPQTVTQGGWGGFSAVAYFFGRKLQEKINVPIGLIEDCVGGTPAETWMSRETLGKMEDFIRALSEMERLRAQGGPEYGNYVMHWYDQYDIGLKNNTWADSELDDSRWKKVRIPGGFEELGMAEAPSVCWFRRKITLPNPLPHGKATIYLGSIDKMDTTYINGKMVGASSWVESQRAYDIGAGVLKAGINVITIRVLKVNRAGGFLSKPDALRLVLGDHTVIPLAGEWKGAVSIDARPPHPMPMGFENYPSIPSVLYMGMIQPVAPLAITGAIWYQGETNANRAYQYRTLLPAMIADWRRAFGQGDFPFYIVSLPAFGHRRGTPGDDDWAELREAQALTARTVPHSGLAVTVDTGDPDDVHPKDKKIVGERLALCALARQYGKEVSSAGPTFTSATPRPGALELHFTHTEGGLVVRGNKLGEFSVSGADRKWYWADASIKGDAVVVSSPMVPHPKAARYAWQSNPLATLFNGAGLPAVPFRTDTWPGITDSNK